jgi:hypothetical protein
MPGSELPTIKVLITPEYSLAQHVTGLLVDLTVPSDQVRQLPEYSELLSFTNSFSASSDSDEEEDTGQAFDTLAQLLILAKSRFENSNIEWVEGRSTPEYMRLICRASPLELDQKGTRESAVDLRCDQGGLLGSGIAFIPLPASEEICRIVVAWDLSKAPSGTRAVWTFGEGPDPVEMTGPSSILCESVYMVGKIQSNPSAALPWTLPDYYGFYWFGDLPPNIQAIRDIHYEFLLKVSEFFQDPPSASNPYRAFVRNNGAVMSFGGTGFTRSHIFDYDDQIAQAHDYDLVRRMSYEMVHNWLGPPSTDDTIDWLYEGISNLLSLYLPFRNGFRADDYFTSTFNTLCMKYYTNPLLRVPLADLMILAPTNDYAKEMIAARAWAFVAGTDFRARELSELKRPVEDLSIKVLAKKRARGEEHGIWEWMDLLHPLMGEEVVGRYKSMLGGSVILLPAEISGVKSYRLRPVQQEVLDFGMDRESFEKGMISGLKLGGRAANAGLREGDKIIWSSHLWKCVDDFQAHMELVVRSGGVEKRVRYWPRSFAKVDSWQIVKVEDQDVSTPPVGGG